MNIMSPSLGTLISRVVTTAVIIGVVFVGLMRVDSYLKLKQTEVRNTAIDGCAEVAQNTFTTSENGQTNVINDINQAPYQQCLTLKNVQ